MDNGFDLAIAQALGVQHRHELEPRSQRVLLRKPLLKRRWLVKGEHPAGARVGVPLISEEGLNPCALVGEGEGKLDVGNVRKR